MIHDVPELLKFDLRFFFVKNVQQDAVLKVTTSSAQFATEQFRMTLDKLLHPASALGHKILKLLIALAYNQGCKRAQIPNKNIIP